MCLQLGGSSENDTEYGPLCQSDLTPTDFSIASFDQGHDGGSYPVILGQVFQRQYLTVYNIDPVSFEAVSIEIAPAARGSGGSAAAS